MNKNANTATSSLWEPGCHIAVHGSKNTGSVSTAAAVSNLKVEFCYWFSSAHPSCVCLCADSNVTLAYFVQHQQFLSLSLQTMAVILFFLMPSADISKIVQLKKKWTKDKKKSKVSIWGSWITYWNCYFLTNKLLLI